MRNDQGLTPDAADGEAFDEIPVPGVPSVFEAVAVVRVQPGDVILFRSPDRLHQAGRAHIAKMMEAVFPRNEIIILEAEQDIAVLRPAAEVSDG